MRFPNRTGFYLGYFKSLLSPNKKKLIYADFVTLVGREAVKEVQKLVGVEADGQWGMGTADAVRAFNANFEAKRSQNPDYAWEVFLQFDIQKRAVFQSLAKENPEKYADHLQK